MSRAHDAYGRAVWLVVKQRKVGRRWERVVTWGGEWEASRRDAVTLAKSQTETLADAGERYVVRKAVLS